MDKYLKALFDLKITYGKKLGNILYYGAIIIALGNLIYSFINSIITMSLGGAQVFQGLWQFVTSPVMFVFYFIIIRIVCELLNLFFDRFGNREE